MMLITRGMDLRRIVYIKNTIKTMTKRKQVILKHWKQHILYCWHPRQEEWTWYLWLHLRQIMIIVPQSGRNTLHASNVEKRVILQTSVINNNHQKQLKCEFYWCGAQRKRKVGRRHEKVDTFGQPVHNGYILWCKFINKYSWKRRRYQNHQ